MATLYNSGWIAEYAIKSDVLLRLNSEFSREPTQNYKYTLQYIQKNADGCF